MSGFTKWALFRIPGGIAILLAILWLFGLFIFQPSGRYDTTNWAGLWPWALGLWLGGSFWMAIPAAFERTKNCPPPGEDAPGTKTATPVAQEPSALPTDTDAAIVAALEEWDRENAQRQANKMLARYGLPPEFPEKDT